MFRNLLVAVDGSEHARRAITAAGDIARHIGAKITLLQVLTRTGGYQVPGELKAFNELKHIRMTEHDVIEAVGREILAKAEKQAVYCSCLTVK